jgi:hypothetical protein
VASPAQETESHAALVVSGWSDPNVLPALATYLVALRTTAIDQAGRISPALLEDDAAAIERSVREITDPPNPCTPEDLGHWKSTFRNAWLAEGIWHCCMRIAMDNPAIHTPGRVIAIDFAHISPKDHGFDVMAIYVQPDDQAGISFVETKAYPEHLDKAISDSLKILKEVEQGLHDTRIRQRVTSMRDRLSRPQQHLITASMWRERRTHIPNPHYDSAQVTVDWGRQRPACKRLASPVLIMPHAVPDYADFFDTLATAMLSKAQELIADV